MTITFPTLPVSHAPCKKTKNTHGPDYVIRTRLLEISKTQNPDNFDMRFLVFSLMSKVSVDSYITPAKSAKQLQGLYERSTMTMTPQTLLQN
jgi:hypothetical protein